MNISQGVRRMPIRVAAVMCATVVAGLLGGNAAYADDGTVPSGDCGNVQFTAQRFDAGAINVSARLNINADHGALMGGNASIDIDDGPSYTVSFTPGPGQNWVSDPIQNFSGSSVTIHLNLALATTNSPSGGYGECISTGSVTLPV